ncbi:MAG TPA: LysR family transcriptional regulator [Pseudonocardiaceae bacterium]|nr:LysR family transcriptional regulator [Pseudonocardiaceae bacterium]
MRDMDVRKLRLLSELDARGTVAEVASSLHMTPSAVSQQIAALGREVGVQLIEPDGRRVRLTGAAKVLVEHAHNILAEVERAWTGLTSYTTGNRVQVRIAGHDGVLGGLGLDVAVRLREVRPDLLVSLHEVSPDQSVAMLLRGEVDVLLGAEIGFEPIVGNGRLLATSVVIDQFDLVLPACHRLACAPTVGLTDLAMDTWVFVNDSMCREIGLAACQAAGFRPTVAHALGDWATTLAAVRMGLGVALVPRLMLTELPPGVVARTPIGEPLRHHVVAITRTGTEQAPHIAVVLDTLTSVIDGRGQRDIA